MTTVSMYNLSKILPSFTETIASTTTNHDGEEAVLDLNLKGRTKTNGINNYNNTTVTNDRGGGGGDGDLNEQEAQEVVVHGPSSMPSSQDNPRDNDGGDVKKNEITNTNPNSTAVKRRVVPLILGAGRGTTGTHTMTEAMCHLGYPSIHYNVGCIPSDEIVEASNEDENGGTESSVISEYYMTFFDISEKLRASFTHLGNCILGQEVCSHPAQPTRDNLVRSIDVLVNYTTTMDIDTIPSLHDTPYPYVMPTVIKSVKKYYNEIMPVIVLTERDPEEYITRRFQSRHSGRDIMCKETTAINPKTLENGVFDFVGCIDSYLSGLSTEEAENATIGQIFTTMGRLYNDIGDEGIAYAVEQVREYQDAVRSIADFSIDFFVEEERVTPEDLADKMISNATSLQSVEKDCEYVNIWKKTRIENF